LVIGQIALSLLLSVAAGLFLRTLTRLQSLNPGFRTSQLISFSIDPALSGYNKQQMLAFFRQTQQALTTVSGVSSVALSRVRLIDGMRWTSRRIAVEGYQARPNEDMEPWVNAVSPDFFATLGIPLIAGRDFRESDERPCAIVNERFAQYYFGDSPAVGKRFGFGGDSDNSLDIEIVGVVRDSKYRSLREDIPRQIYMLYLQTGTPTAMHVYIRTILPAQDLLRAVRGAISAIDSSVPVYDVRTIEQQIERSLILERAIAVLAAGLAAVAMLLAIIGLYGVMAYTVARRTREIGLRIALGACAPHVVMVILKDVLILTSCGVVVGLTATLPFRHYINSQLYDLAPEDPVTLIGATVILYFVAVISACLPARQASRLDPLRALRYD
jgi:predicted permease